MTTTPVKSHLLIFEPRLGGHHLSWLRFVSEDLLAAGLALTLAVDLRPGGRESIEGELADLLPRLTMISAYDGNGRYRGGTKMAALVECFAESGADEVFMTNFDEMASNLLRRAAVGIDPPKVLRGRLSGFYFRPRFLASRWWPVGNILKGRGFKRLCRGGWFRNIYLLDEYLLPVAQSGWPGPDYRFLPDVWQGDYSQDKLAARRELGLAPEQFVFLNYGIGTRRKGLHLVLRAFRQGGLPEGASLLCAGKIGDDRELREGAAELAARGSARLLNRYVSDREEALCFAACDAVLLPYVEHFGSSGVLSRTAAAGKPVIASDEGLVARRVSSHRLGVTFRSGSVDELHRAMAGMMGLDKEGLASYREAAARYAPSCSRQAFGQALAAGFRR